MDKLKLQDYQATLSQVLLAPELTLFNSIYENMNLTETSSEEKRRQEARLKLNIYRNNVTFSLTQAIQAQFPIVYKLVGKNFFLALARDYVRLYPPQTASLTFYGEQFPGFIRNHDHCNAVPYLADVALLEWHCQTSLNASDEALLAIEELSVVAPEKVGDLHLPLQSSVILFSSTYPVDRIREEHLKENPATINIKNENLNNGLVFRKELTVSVINLKPEAFFMLKEFEQGKNINQAWQSTQQQFSLNEEALTPLLSFLLNLGVFKSFQKF